jgi:hypothetical protein
MFEKSLGPILEKCLWSQSRGFFYGIKVGDIGVGGFKETL